MFSGRPDPVWTITERQRASLIRLWTRLGPTRERQPTAPSLGYRGAELACPSGERWFAYGGVASLTVNRIEELRADPKRAFERAILETAPRGMVPRVF